MNSTIKKYLFGCSSIILIFVIWQLVAVYQNNDYVFPKVLEIFKNIGYIFSNHSSIKVLGITLLNVVIVILSAFLIALLISFIYIIIPHSIYFFKPIINILKAAPFAIISIYILYAFFEYRDIAPSIVAFLVIFPLMIEGIIGAIDNIDKSIIDDLKMLNINPFRKFIAVYVPLCVPYIVTTFLQSFGLGLKVMIMSEYMNQVDGTIGGVLVNLKGNLEGYGPLLAWLIIIIVIVAVGDLLVKLISKHSKKISIK